MKLFGRDTGYKRRFERGQSIAEFALVTPFLLILALGVIEVGRYAYIAISVGNAARAGAAFARKTSLISATSNSADIVNAATNDYKNNGNYTTTKNSQGKTVSTLTVTDTVTCGCDNGGTTTLSAVCTGITPTCAAGHWVVMVDVTATGTYKSLFNYPGIPNTITVTDSATVRVPQD